MKPTHSGADRWRRKAVSTYRLGGSVALACCLISGCAPPDRPARVLEDPTGGIMDVLAPDSMRQLSVDDGVWYRVFWSSRGPWAVHLLAVDLGRCELGIQTLPAPPQDGSPGGRARVSRLLRMAGNGVLAGGKTSARSVEVKVRVSTKSSQGLEYSSRTRTVSLKGWPFST